MFTRFNGNVVPFADDATSTNRTVFGGTTQSDLIDDNLNTNFKKGWEIVGLNDNPTREDFNAMGYTLGALISYLYEMGISEWNASQNYRANSRVTGSDGKIYKSLTGTTGTPNVNHNPTSDAINWELEFKDFVDLINNQTIAGIKTFSSFPITPSSAPTTNYQVANKKYVDDNNKINTLTNKTTPVDADEMVIADSTSSFSLKKLSFTNLKATLKTYFDTLYKVASSETTSGIIEIATTAEAQAGTDDLRAITPLKLRNSVLGLGQTWQDVTASRSAGVTYTNTTGKPIVINISTNTSAMPEFTMQVDGVLVAFTRGINDVDFLSAVVPNGSTYKCNLGGGTSTIFKWVELR